jgi:branched-chain amino acid transport system permease protein
MRLSAPAPGTVLTLVAFALLVALPYLASTSYTIQLATIALMWVLMAQGLNVIQGETGYVSIAQAGFMGVGAYASVLLVLRFGFPVWGAMLLAPLVASLLAAVIGFPTLRVKGHYFAIVTLAYNLVIFIALSNAVSLTGGEGGLSGIPRPESLTLPFFGIVSFRNRVNYYYLTLAVAGTGYLCAWLISRSGFGRVLRSIRQNEPLAEAVGVDCRKYKLVAFVISAAYAGAAGALYAHLIGFINPTPFAPEASLNTILAVIVGGSGTVAGPAVGAFIATFLPEFLRVGETARFIAYGLILIVATIYLPRGLVPAIGSLFSGLYAGIGRRLKR